MQHSRIEVTGHRGAAAVEPENTLRGIAYALSLGVDRVEIDVRLTRDRALIVMHDANVERTTNGSGAVAELTLKEIKELDAGAGERVPTLQEVLELFKGAWRSDHGARLQIELKGPATAEPTAEIVEREALEDKVIFTSFEAERLAEAKRLLPAVARGFLASTLEPDPLKIALSIGATAIHLHHEAATREWVQQVHAAGLEARLWNIDDAERMKRAAALGVDGIGSNDPQLLIKVLNERLPTP